METEQIKNKTADLAGHVGELIETYSKLLVTKAVRQAAKLGSSLITTVIASFLAFFAFIFLSLALAWWLGDVVNSRVGGFAIVAGFFILLAVLLWSSRKKGIIPYFRNLIVRSIYDE